MKFGFKEMTIEMGIFDFSVACIIGDYKGVDEYIRWKFDDKDFNASDWDGGYIPRGKVFYRVGFVPVLWLQHKPRTAREHATLAHEALHCVSHLFRWAHIPMTEDTEEVVGHSLAHIVNGVLSSRL